MLSPRWSTSGTSHTAPWMKTSLGQHSKYSMYQTQALLSQKCNRDPGRFWNELVAFLNGFGCSVHFLFSFAGHVPSQFKTLQWLPSALGLKSKLMSSPKAPACFSYFLLHYSLCSVTLGSFLFLKPTKLFPTPGLAVPPAWKLLPHLPQGWCPHPFGCTFLKEALCDYSLQRRNQWPLSSYSLPCPPASFLHRVYYIMQLSCYFFACLLSVSSFSTSGKWHSVRDLFHFIHRYILSTYCVAGTVLGTTDLNPCSRGAYILVGETDKSHLKQMNDIIFRIDEYFNK